MSNTARNAQKGKIVSVTAPLDIESPREGSNVADGVVIRDDISIHTNPIADDEHVVASEQSTASAFRDDPAMTFVYLGIITLAVIIAAAAMLAL